MVKSLNWQVATSAGGVVRSQRRRSSLPSICCAGRYARKASSAWTRSAMGNVASKPLVSGLIDTRIQRDRLVPIHLKNHEKIPRWIEPGAVDATVKTPNAMPAHILSPFDLLVIQRKQSSYSSVTSIASRPMLRPPNGCSAIFVLLADGEIVAAFDLKADRQARKLLVQKWTWIAKRRAGLETAIEEALAPFERFQMA